MAKPCRARVMATALRKAAMSRIEWSLFVSGGLTMKK